MNCPILLRVAPWHVAITDAVPHQSGRTITLYSSHDTYEAACAAAADLASSDPDVFAEVLSTGDADWLGILEGGVS